MILRPYALRPGARLSLAALLTAVAPTACSTQRDEPDGSDYGADVYSDLGLVDATATPDVPQDTGPIATRNRQRFPIGSTLYLPVNGNWRIATAPATNRNTLFTDARSGRSAFVPHVAGEHQLTNGREVLSVTAVAVDAVGFVNRNAFPSRPVAFDEATAVVVSTLRPELYVVDRNTLAATATIATGAWPVAVATVPGRGIALVAARGEDTLSVVDLTNRRTTRSVWVGDEPSNVVVTPDGNTVLVTLATDRQVVILSANDYSELGRVDVGFDPTHLAVRADSQRAYVAGRRTGAAATVGMDASGADISEINLMTRAVTRTVASAGSTLGGIAVSGDGARLYVAATRNDNLAGALTDPMRHPFQHTLVAYDLNATDIVEVTARDVTRSLGPIVLTDGGVVADAGAGDAGTTPGADGPLATRALVGLGALAERDGSLWVAVEGTDMVLRFDTITLAEQERFDVPGRPRGFALAGDGAVLAYGHQTLQATLLTGTATRHTARTGQPLARDPRADLVARGEAYFTGVGQHATLPSGQVVSGETWSCSSCHADGLGDRLEWSKGPLTSHRGVARAFTLLDGTWPYGQEGAVGDLTTYVFASLGDIGVTRPSAEQADALTAYVASIAAPGAAVSTTSRDGELSPEAQRGLEHFARHCDRCHTAPLMTNRALVAQSVGDMLPSDPPTLIGAYRAGTYFRRGTGRGLADAVSQMVTWITAPLDMTQRADLTRYVSELSGRDFFLLAEAPRRASPLPTTQPITLTFSQPVFDRGDNLARVQLQTSAGQSVGARVAAAGTRVTVTATAPLLFDTVYRVVVNAGFESDLEVQTRARDTVEFRTVAQPTLRVSGTYTLTYTPAVPGMLGGTGAPQTATLTLSSDAGGLVTVTASYPGNALTWRGTGSLGARTLRLPPMPLPVGSTFAEASSGFQGTLADSDNDMIGESVLFGTGDGGTRGYVMSGPGYQGADLDWNLVRTR